jgi:hypothetical protein
MLTCTKVALACLVLLAAAPVFAQTDPSGHWEGTLQVPNGPNVLELDLARNGQGAWIASMGVPQQNASGLRIADLHVDGNKITCNAPDVPGRPSFELTFAAGKLIGTLSMQGHSLPLEMQRTGEAKVDVAPPNPAVSRQLEGDWEGTLSSPDGSLNRQVIVHFKNQPDRTVLATIDSPSQGARGLVLSGVVEKDGAVEFYLKGIGGSYKGKLNQQATEIAGEWTQRPGSAPLPLVLKKK